MGNMEKTNKRLKTVIDIKIWESDPTEMNTMLQTLNAGKLTGKWIPDSTPIIGKNGETIRNEDIKFIKMFYGLQEFIPRLSFEPPKGLIYVINLSNHTFPEDKNPPLSSILKRNHWKNIPLAIFANKDGSVDCTEEDLVNYMGIIKHLDPNRVLSIFKTSTISGEGIREGIYWLIDAIVGNKSL
jgi:hypothetical protein